jgi:hypothetical protein
MIDIDADEQYRNQVKANYEFSTWAGHVKEGNRDARLAEVLVLPEQLDRWRLEEKEELPSFNRQQRIVRYIYNSSRDGGGARVDSTVFECNSAIEAHETLIDVVMTYMAPNLPRCETKGLEVGDICFGSHGEVNLSVIFARLNILVEIKNAGREAVSVNEFAENVDALILSQYRGTKNPGSSPAASGSL